MATDVRDLDPPVLPIGEAHLRAILEKTFDITAIVGADGTLLYESPASRAIAGRDPNERMSKHAFDHVHPDDLPLAQRIMQEMVERRLQHSRLEIRIRHVDGTWRILDTSVTNLLDDPAVQGLVVICRDVTERREGEIERARLLASEHEARTTAEHSLGQLLNLQSIADLLSTTLTAEGVSLVIVDRGVAALGAVGGFVGLLTPSGESIDMYGSRTWRNPNQVRRRWRRIAADSPCALAEAARLGEPIWIESQRAWMERYRSISAARGSAHRAEVALPLLVNGRLAGALSVSFDEERVFSNTDRLFIRLLGRQCAQALERVRLYQELGEREQRLQELVRRLLAGQEEERRRIAYELHDGLAQVATGAHQHLQVLATRYPPKTREHQEDWQRALQLAQRTVREARTLIRGLRPTVLDDFGLVRAIGVEVDGLRAEGINVRFDPTLGEERLAPPLETALFRVAQEGLTNIRKHARASRARVSVGRRGQTVRLVVRDWGCGFNIADARRPGATRGMQIGLEGMDERMRLVGGRCIIRSEPGRGTIIDVSVPVAPTTAWASTG